MRRRKATISIAALTALTLVTGCSSNLVEDKNGNVITMSIGDQVVSIAGSELLDDYLKTPAGLKSYYDAVYETVVRELFEQPTQATKRNDIYNKAKRDVESTKEKARSNASNGGSYDKELETLLNAEGVETLKELEEKKAYVHMQTELKDQFFDGGTGAWIENAWDTLVSGDQDYAGYLAERLPYHVRHILIKVGAGRNTFTDATITKDDATKLGSAVSALAKRTANVTFGRLALEISEDEGSAKEFGDLKIMDIKTEFVNEFKLGVYTYEGIFAGKDATNKLGIPSDVKTFFDTEVGLAEVPFEAAEKLVEVAEKEKDALGNEVNDGKTEYFPRNIYFNKYFNMHNVAVVTPTKIGVVGEDPVYANYAGFQFVPELGKKVLTDESGNVVLMVRAGSNGGYEGVHFITVERSALDATGLADYYSIDIPDINDPLAADTFVNYFRQDTSSYKSRADYLKNQIKNFDSRIDDRIFTLLYDQLDVEIHDKDLEKAIFAYIDAQYVSARNSDGIARNNKWVEYMNYIDNQNNLRDHRLVAESCAVDFDNASSSSSYTDPTGACYYVK